LQIFICAQIYEKNVLKVLIYNNFISLNHSLFGRTVLHFFFCINRVFFFVPQNNAMNVRKEENATLRNSETRTTGKKK